MNVAMICRVAPTTGRSLAVSKYSLSSRILFLLIAFSNVMWKQLVLKMCGLLRNKLSGFITILKYSSRIQNLFGILVDTQYSRRNYCVHDYHGSSSIDYAMIFVVTAPLTFIVVCSI